MVIRILNKLRGKIEKLTANFNKKIVSIKKTENIKKSVRNED